MNQIPTINMADTGRNILRLRQLNKMSVKELQDIFGFATPQAIYKWQHGTALPSVDNLIMLAVVFCVWVEDIIAVEMMEQVEKSA